MISKFQKGILALIVYISLFANISYGQTVKMVKDINPGADGSNPYYLTVFNNKLYFSVTDYSRSNEGLEKDGLWEFDGISTPKPFYKFKSDYVNIIPSFLTEFNDKLFFQANDSIHGLELWEYDGTNNPEMVYDIYSGTNYSSPYNLIVFNNKLNFWACNGTCGCELWEYDDISNPVMVKDILNGSRNSSPVNC